MVATFVSGNEKTFRKINRSAAGVRFGDAIEGLRKLACMKRDTGKGLDLGSEILSPILEKLLLDGKIVEVSSGKEVYYMAG